MIEQPELAAPATVVLGTRVALPQPKHEVLVRERLVERLTQGAAGPLTLVHAPAGSGKTLMVGSWISSRAAPGPVAWVACDPEIDAPGPFWAHVREALRRGGVRLGDSIGLPASANEIDPEFLAALAAQLSEQAQPVVLVLDEYGAITTPAIHEGLEYVLRNADPHVRLVVISREVPPLHVARHRAAGELVEIGPQDLSCTAEEADALLRLHGTPLGPDDLDELMRRTGGWLTGLRLSALSLRRGSSPGEVRQRLEDAHGDISAFLLAEVLDQQPPETRDLLLRTCLLERVSGDLADALTGRHDGRARLQGLAETGTFVRIVPGTSWFVLHDIFATALQRRLLLTDDSLAPRLRRQASTWLADHGLLVEAIAQAVAAQEWDLAAGHVVDHLAIGHVLVGLQTHVLAQLFAEVPTNGSSPQVALVRGGLAMARFDVAGCVEALDQADRGSSAVDSSRRPALRLCIAAVRVIVSRLTGDVEAGEAAGSEARQLLTQLDPARLDAHPELTALLMSSLGTLQLWSGSLVAAEDSLRAGLDAAVGPFTEQPRSNCLGQLAFIHYLRGQLHEAARCAMEAMELVERAGLSPGSRVPVAHLAAAAVAWEWGDAAAVRAHLDQASSSVAVRHDPSLTVLLGLLEGRSRLTAGDPAGALRVVVGLHDAVTRLPRGSLARALVVRDEATALLATGHPDEAVALLSQLPESDPGRRLGLARAALASGRPGAARESADRLADDPAAEPALAIRARLLQAQALAATGDSAGAERRLHDALRQARPEGYREAFAEVAPFVRQVLAAAPALAAQHTWLGEHLAGATPSLGGGGAVPSLVVEALTARELDVLRVVARPMSTREAAAAMHLSENTVKTHLRSVYRKLAAGTRNQAIRRARVLGLL